MLFVGMKSHRNDASFGCWLKEMEMRLISTFSVATRRTGHIIHKAYNECDKTAARTIDDESVRERDTESDGEGDGAKKWETLQVSYYMCLALCECESKTTIRNET